MAISRNQLLVGGGIVGVLTILYFLSRKKNSKLMAANELKQQANDELVLGGVRPIPMKVVREEDKLTAKITPETRLQDYSTTDNLQMGVSDGNMDTLRVH